ncbi:MAG TPA: hypothetical protein PLP27_00315 [Crocinitomicaceae bacterium]|nr:hypothetical protein [Crocinitomicaceae bacterium]
MNIQARKLNLITYIAELKDDKFFEMIENYIFKKSPQLKNADFSPFTVEELIKRIETSERDFANGNYKSQDDIEKESENW